MRHFFDYIASIENYKNATVVRAWTQASSRSYRWEDVVAELKKTSTVY